MRRLILRAITAGSLTAALAATAAPLAAQSIFDTGLRAGPQVIQYQIKSPIDETITEIAVPVFVIIPVSSALSFDVGTSYAYARYERNSASDFAFSEFSGLTDTQVRANYSIGTDFVVLTAGVNLPTGRETASQNQLTAATRIGSDFLAFPISNFGTGFGGTAGIAIARPVGDWNLGIGASARRSAAYDPFEDQQGNRLRFQPGNEYRTRVGIDRMAGSGRLMLGLTYSKFGNDRLLESIYNTGDRYVAQGSYTSAVAGGDLVVAGWNLYRASGTILGGTRTGHENIANVLVGLGYHAFGGYLQPSVEVRHWQQETTPSSVLASLGLRVEYDLAGFGISPSAGFSAGHLGSNTSSANLLGFRGALTIRVGQ